MLLFIIIIIFIIFFTMLSVYHMFSPRESCVRSKEDSEGLV